MGSWRLFKLRQDFIAADKVQMEDDITASAVVPASMLTHLPKSAHQPQREDRGQLRISAVPAAR